MTEYYFSFRLADRKTPKGTYQERYDALYDAIKDNANGYWLDPTSFGIFGSELSFAEVVELLKAAIDESVDLVIVGMIYIKGVAVIGDYGNDIEFLRSLIPDIDEE